MKKQLLRIAPLPALLAAIFPIACDGGSRGGGSAGQGGQGGAASSGAETGGFGGVGGTSGAGGAGGAGGQQAQCSAATASVDCDDGNSCTQETCPLGICVHSAEPNGVSCGTGMHCDGKGSCVPLTVVWAKSFGSTYNQLFTGVGVDSRGNLGLVGWYKNTADFGGGSVPVPIIHDGYAVKLDTTGGFLWNNVFPSSTEVVPNSFRFDDSGHCFVSGSFRQTVNLGADEMIGPSAKTMFAAKYTSDGAHVWSKRFGETGGEGTLMQSDVDAEGNLYVSAVYSAGVVDFGCGPLAPAGGFDALAAKLDPAGNCVWSKRFGDAALQQGSAIAADKLGNVVIVGILAGSADFGGGPVTTSGGQDVFVAKLDSTGNHVWSKRFGGGAADQLGMSVAVTDDGEIAVSGWFSGTLDFGGNPLVSAGAADAFVAKLDANGNHVWSNRFGATLDDAVRGVEFDKWGNVVIAGFSRGTIDLGNGPMASPGGTDVVVVKYAGADGQHIWSGRYGDAADQIGTAITVDPLGYPVVVGDFEGSIDFGPGDMVTAGGFDAFVVKFAP